MEEIVLVFFQVVKVHVRDFQEMRDVPVREACEYPAVDFHVIPLFDSYILADRYGSAQVLEPKPTTV